MTPGVRESLLGYHPCSIGFLTSSRDPVGGQCQVRSLTGAVASERVSEALKGSLRMVGNHSKSAKAEGSLTSTPDIVPQPVHGCWLEIQYCKGGIPTATLRQLASPLPSLPPILYMQ